MAELFTPIAVGHGLLGNYAPVVHPPLGPDFLMAWGGEVRPLEDPVLGGGGAFGSIWVPMLARLRARRVIDRAVVTVLAPRHLRIGQLLPAEPILEALRWELEWRERTGVPTSHVLLQLGPDDVRSGTTPARFRRALHQVIAEIEALAPAAAILLARDSHVSGLAHPTLASVQTEVASRLRLPRGPDLDRVGASFRAGAVDYDDGGQARAADAWADAVVRSLDGARRVALTSG